MAWRPVISGSWKMPKLLSRPAPSTLLWCLLPLNLVPLLLSHARPLYDLGGAGFAAASLHVWLARRARDAGQKYV